MEDNHQTPPTSTGETNGFSGEGQGGAGGVAASDGGVLPNPGPPATTDQNPPTAALPPSNALPDTSSNGAQDPVNVSSSNNTKSEGGGEAVAAVGEMDVLFVQSNEGEAVPNDAQPKEEDKGPAGGDGLFVVAAGAGGAAAAAATTAGGGQQSDNNTVPQAPSADGLFIDQQPAAAAADNTEDVFAATAAAAAAATVADEPGSVPAMETNPSRDEVMDKDEGDEEEEYDQFDMNAGLGAAAAVGVGAATAATTGTGFEGGAASSRRMRRSYRPPLMHQATWHPVVEKTKEQTTKHCFPKGFGLHLIPLVLSVSALTLTAAGSWDCSFFQGATIGFTGENFGLWTLEDTTGKCQLWDKLFFSFDLGAPLIAARVFSMSAMLLGLALTATMAQASQFHLASWGIAVALFLVFIISLSTTSIYNVWAVFWLWTYCIMVLIIRFLFIHPVPRRISQRGCKIIAGFFVVCFVCCLLTLVVLKSDWCTCNNITTEYLNGRNAGNPCDGDCELGAAGYLMILASIFWMGSSVATILFGIQPEELQESVNRPRDMYAHYPQQSIVTRAANFVKTTAAAASGAASHSFGSHHSTGASTKSSASASSSSETEMHQSNSNQNDGGKALETHAEEEEDDGGEEKKHGSQESPQDAANRFQEEAPSSEYDIMAPGDEELPDDGDDNNRKINTGSGSDEWDDEDTRNFCSKCCCDFRVKPRTRKEKILFWTFRTVLGFGLFIYFLFIYMLIGSRAENTAAAKAPETTPYFTMDEVCAYNPDDPNQPFETFPNRAAAKSINWTVAHCGECGKCSNPHDIITYVETRKTIAKSSKACGTNVYLGTYEDVADCLEERIGFTRPCTNCWADNMMNTGEKCLSTCLRTLFSGFMTNNNVEGAGDEGWLNQCLFCDEKRSGPAFVTCSGVARRRLGIVSEIERNPEEQCTRMDIEWEFVDFESINFYKNGEQP